MNTIITPLHKNLTILVTFCMLLLFIRIKITNSLFYVFLIWNLFLAIVPFLISEKMKNMNIEKYSKVKLSFITFIWLIFLPNAPYIITDFIHLHHSKSYLFWYDILLLFIFATTGLLLAIISLQDVYKIIYKNWNQKIAQYFITVVPFLCGFGIYLGRFVRLNSWEIFTAPRKVVKNTLYSFLDLKTWFITITFGALILILFKVSKSIAHLNNAS